MTRQRLYKLLKIRTWWRRKKSLKERRLKKRLKERRFAVHIEKKTQPFASSQAQTGMTSTFANKNDFSYTIYSARKYEPMAGPPTDVWTHSLAQPRTQVSSAWEYANTRPEGSS